MPDVYLILPTYNGAKFLPEQLESVLRQTKRDWRLLIRDDHSSDETPSILEKYASHDRRIQILPTPAANTGLRKNISSLLEHALDEGARYVFLLDQDDIWDPKKVANQLQLLQETEALVGEDTPLLAHSDSQLIDRNGRLIHPSFMSYQRIHHEPDVPIRTLLTQNFVTGCTCLLNRPLLRIATPIPAGAILHDWWIALCAAASGEILFSPLTSVYYRQHDKNLVGAKSSLKRIRRLLYPRQHESGPTQTFLESIRQSETLIQRFAERGIYSPTEPRLALINQYLAALRVKNRLSRASRVVALGIRRQGLLRTAWYLLQIIYCGRHGSN